MKYQSTRGGVSGLSFEDVVRSGYASDGGMFMPESIPHLSDATLQSWKDLSYPDIVKRIANIFIEDEIPSDKLEGIIDVAFQSFPDAKNPIVHKTLSNGMLMMEMYHGRSMAFKDLSMTCAAQILDFFLERAESTVNLLIATSGDTGSSALQAVSAVQRCNIVVILPRDRISAVQELQMTTVVADNCQVVRADGSSDDTDMPIKRLFMDAEFADKYNLGSLNSVNWCRMMVQMAFHFYAYFQGKKLCQEKEPVEFVPTGGLGNATAACIAHEMGLPVKVVCSVTNDALMRTVHDNDYSVGELNLSIAPAMNIQVPYNFERIIYAVSGGDVALVKKTMSDYEVEGKASLPTDLLNKVKEIIDVMLISDDEILETIKSCYQQNDSYVICPHTATGLAAALRHADKEKHSSVLLGVASPEKFSESIVKSGVDWKGRDLLTELREKKSAYVDWEADDDWYEKLKQLVIKMTERSSSFL